MSKIYELKKEITKLKDELETYKKEAEKRLRTFGYDAGFVTGFFDAQKGYYKGLIYQTRKNIFCSDENLLKAYQTLFDDGYEDGYKIATEIIQLKKLLKEVKT